MNAGLKKVRVLLAMTDEIHRLLIREYLEMDPRFEVKEVERLGPLHLLCKGAAGEIGLVLLDMELLRTDSLDLVLAIRKSRPSLLVLAMTSRLSHLGAEKKLRQKGVGFIQKPFSPYQLHRSIQALRISTPHQCFRPESISVRNVAAPRRRAFLFEGE